MKLRPVTLYEFHTGRLHGFFNGSGSCPGIEITRAGEQSPLTPPDGSLFSLTHYLCNAASGPEAPHGFAGRGEEATESALSLHFPSSEEWPLEAIVTYALAEEGFIDIDFHFRFQEDILGFEVQVVSAFTDNIPPAHVHIDGEWFRPVLKAKEVCFFARDEEVATIIESGRWDFYLARGYNVVLDERGYDYPIMAYLDEKSGYALVQMMLTDECPSLCISSQPSQQNFSLLGRDVKSGEQIRCHARLVYGPFSEVEKILSLYQKFIREVREARPPAN